MKVLPLKRVASVRPSNVDKKSRVADLPVRLCNYTDVYYGDRLRHDGDYMRATATPEQVRDFGLRDGDVIITKDSETADDIGIPAYVQDPDRDQVCGYHLTLIRPDVEVLDGRFLFWQLSSAPVLAHWTTEASGVTRYGLRASAVANLPLRVPRLPEQRAIADFLDTETARIDALITKKQRLADAIVERASMAFHAAVTRLGGSLPDSVSHEALQGHKWPDGWHMLLLGRCLRQLTNGYVGPTRDILVDDGIRYIQSLHIKNGIIDFARRPYYVTPQWFASRPRIQLREGDVLIVQTGDIGQVACVPPDFGAAACHALQIARPETEVIQSSYLTAYLRSPHGYAALLQMATGALHPHLEGSIRQVPIPVPPLGIQTQIVERVDRETRATGDTVQRVERQIELLREHRQALITAAVTGQMDVLGVAA